MGDTLFAKTFIILGSQLLLTFIATRWVIEKFRQMHAAGHRLITSSRNENNELDLHINFEEIKHYFWGLLIVDIIVFLLLLFLGQNDMRIGIPLFSIWSVLTGIELALVLISVDENLGARVLGITATIVFITAWFGIYSGIDFGFLGGILLFALLGLLIANVVRIFIQISRARQRVLAGIGVVIFTGYLLYDFNRLAKLQAAGVNSWQAAMRLAISLYLDIINLFLDLLDLLSD